MVPQAKKRAIHAIIIKHKYKITSTHTGPQRLLDTIFVIPWLNI